MLSNARNLAFYGLIWWKKQEYLEETIVLGQATSTLSYADTGIWSRATTVITDGFTSALSRSIVHSLFENQM